MSENIQRDKTINKEGKRTTQKLPELCFDVERESPRGVGGETEMMKRKTTWQTETEDEEEKEEDQKRRPPAKYLLVLTDVGYLYIVRGWLVS